MRATRAYIASAGTAVVMLGASLAMFALVSGFVAFGSWPGAKSATEVDQVVLNSVATPKAKAVAVRSDAVAVARRAEVRREVALAHRQAPTPPAQAGTPVARTPATTAPTAGAAPVSSGTQVAVAPPS